MSPSAIEFIPKNTNQENQTIKLSSKRVAIKYRTIDDYFEEAQKNAPRSCRFYYWVIFMSMGIANMGDATEISCMNYVLSNPDFIAEILDNNVKKHGATLASAIFVGMLIGGVVTGVIGDQLFGRKRILLTGLLINSIAGLCSALAPSLKIICFARFTSGIGIGAVLSSLITLTTELSPSSQRGLYVSFVASFWTAGSIFVALLGYNILGRLELSWRIFLACCAAPSFLAFVLVAIFVPESARFLALHGDFERAAHEANVVAVKGIGYRNGRLLTADELAFHFSLRGNVEGNQRLKDAPPVPSYITRRNLVMNSFTRIKSLYGHGLRRKTIPLHILWFTLSFGSGICTWINTIFAQVNGITDVYLGAFFFASANIPGNFAAAIFLDKFGRRMCFVTSVFGSVIALVFFAHAVYQEESNPARVVGFACLFHCFLVGCWCSLSCMTGEMLPTKVRGTGMGMCSASGRIAAILAQFINGALMDKPAFLIMIAAAMMAIGGLTPYAFQMEELSMQHLEDDVPEEEERKKLDITVVSKELV